jgi:hypothetical protein
MTVKQKIDELLGEMVGLGQDVRNARIDDAVRKLADEIDRVESNIGLSAQKIAVDYWTKSHDTIT